MKSTISNKCPPCRCSGLKAWCLKAMGQHVMSTGICIGFSNKIQMSSSSTTVPAEGAVISSLLHYPPSALSGQLCLPHPSREYALTHSTLHELEETAYLSCLSQPLVKLAKLAKRDYWSSRPDEIIGQAGQNTFPPRLCTALVDLLQQHTPRAHPGL